VSFFTTITNGAFALEGEGVLSIRVFMMDFAQNESYFVVRYKIDKTGPQLVFKDITEINDSDTTHYASTDRVARDLNVSKNDASEGTS
jgi:hypothetical protein